ACGAIVGLELGYSGVRLLTTKPVGEKKPVNLSLTKLPLEGRIEVIYSGEKVEVKRTEKGIIAMSMVCTHLGCLVIWEEEKRQYHCPCHDAYFDEDGQVISGPPTQPLEKIPVTVSGNTVIIGG
ncbi:ubiquinol-cytochrome c reductase iron-sulfur subunit, partial [candidate division KSB1 bacterium]